MSEVLAPPTDTFIRVAELWVPEGDRLVFRSGSYGGLHGFAQASRQETFARGEGLPGRAWDEARPIVLREFDGSYFKRVAAATAAGLTSAVAVPVFAGKALKAVLVILCGSDADHMGAIEVWRDNGSSLELDGGYYGNATAFETVSQRTHFSNGQGLPGGVWAAQTPILMRDLGAGYGFLRAAAAGLAGLKHGLGLPVPAPGKGAYVLTVLSSANTPVARRFEIWDARPAMVGATRRAVLIDGICEREGPLRKPQDPAVDAAPSIGAWQGPAGQVLGSGLPWLQLGGSGLPAGYGSVVALPVYRDTELAHVVAWYL